MTGIKLKRAYDDISEDDGIRILVDRLWPRGIKKSDLKLDEWAKEITPSTNIRKKFNHDKNKFDEFKRDYNEELNNNKAFDAFIKQIEHWLKSSNVTLIYGAKDREINHGVVLKEAIEKQLK